MQTSWAETYPSLGAEIKSVYIREVYLVNELSKGWTRIDYESSKCSPRVKYLHLQSPQVPQKYSQQSKLVFCLHAPEWPSTNEPRLSPQIHQKPTGLYKALTVEPSLPPTPKSPTMPFSPCSREKQSDEPTDYNVSEPPGLICALLPKSVAKAH